MEARGATCNPFDAYFDALKRLQSGHREAFLEDLAEQVWVCDSVAECSIALQFVGRGMHAHMHAAHPLCLAACVSCLVELRDVHTVSECSLVVTMRAEARPRSERSWPITSDPRPQNDAHRLACSPGGADTEGNGLLVCTRTKWQDGVGKLEGRDPSWTTDSDHGEYCEYCDDTLARGNTDRRALARPCRDRRGLVRQPLARLLSG